ncbi:HAMP domain-containing histidine kinase [Christensenellaceae bacterium OttesenSCG-928-K19]|nr:HAMP domain-containing histidine kinase [Christensenellaceae bacterium OttesenSCG-928-K19]
MLFMAIIMVSLFISGALISSLMRETYLEDNQTQLTRILDNLESWGYMYNNGYIEEALVESVLQEMAKREDVVVWVVKNDNKTIKYAGGEVTWEEVAMYYEKMLANLQENQRDMVVEEEANFFNTPVITAAAAIDHGVGADQYCYIFVHRRISALNEPLMAVYRSIVLSIAIAAVLAMLLTYFFTRSMLRPLSVVARGAKQLARGHFDIWLEVKSEDEIGQLADTFNVVARDLKKSQQTQDSFVANVSHELRSPLTSIQGMVQGVIDGIIPKNEELHYLSVVLDETKRMNGLISDLLDLAKIESGQFPMQVADVEVNEMVRRLLITFERKIDVKNLMVEVEFQNNKQYAQADENRLMQVLQNLMDNAIKFADYGGRLRISTMTDDKLVYVSVNNSGEPIPRSMIPSLFDRFYKGDESHTRVKEGTGIGLSIVKKILEEHRQKIWVESDSIGGTTFTFTLNKSQEKLEE